VNVNMIHDFHFIRPWWLLAIIPTIVIFVLMLKVVFRRYNIWHKYCDKHLLPYLIDNQNVNESKILAIIICSSIILMIIALSGPTWSLESQNVYRNISSQVIALDVSDTMNLLDIQPSRLKRAKFKIIDLLRQQNNIQTSLLVFSSYAFVASPLTNDSNTIINMLPAIDSSVVPVQGSSINQALIKSGKILIDNGIATGNIVIFTASVPDNNSYATATTLFNHGYRVSIVGMGKNSTFEVTQNALQQLAKAGGGVYTPFTDNNDDIDSISNEVHKNIGIDVAKEQRNLWKDEGYIFIWLLIIVIIFVAKRGWLNQLC
jgi:Ca-activated chloride channel family protein